MQTYWLSTHLGYACRHSGACCSSGWPIPIEGDRASLVRRAIDEGRVRPAVMPWLEPAPKAPSEVAGILAHRPDGDCVFHGPSGCAIYDARPRSCEHFPHVCVTDARGVHVTLSHYCPTAASMLFRDGVPDIVEGPPVVPGDRDAEGLDARESLPPTEMDADADTDGDAETAEAAEDADNTEAAEAAEDAENTKAAEAAEDAENTKAAEAADNAENTEAAQAADSADNAGKAERSRARRPRLMGWDAVSRWERRTVRAVASDARVPGPADLALFAHARDAVPAALAWPDAPPDVDRAQARWVAPVWHSWAPVVGRYLAAKVHASWAMHLGDGPRDVLRGVDIARSVLQVEAARLCARASRPLDRPLLESAIRQSDLLLVHYADPSRLVRR